MNYKNMMKQYKVDMLDALNRFLMIPSVYDEATSSKEKPFGENVDKALKYIGSLGERYGFDVDYCDGYATELTIGEGKKLIGIFAHADVVPAIGKWDNDPFTPTIKDNNLYARGSSDDKGPLIAAFYATKALRDNGLLRDYRVRIVVGGDEERGSRCLEHYFHDLHKEAPTFGFTPDSDFPLIYGEKGITDFVCELDENIPNVKSIDGGLVSNAVCDNVKVTLIKEDSDFISFLKRENIKFSQEGNVVTFLGKAVHGSTPELGVNAALIALKALGDFYKVEKLSNLGEKLADTTGKSFGCFSHSDLLKDTTYCVGIVKYENDKLFVTVNFRYNELVNPKEFVEKFDKFFGTKSLMHEPSKHLLFDPKCTLVQTLLKAYRSETGDKSEPLTTGGGTYAKHAPNTVAFGALFPNRVSSMHEPNEYLNLDEFYLSAEIYAHAIKLLGDIDED